MGHYCRWQHLTKRRLNRPQAQEDISLLFLALKTIQTAQWALAFQVRESKGKVRTVFDQDMPEPPQSTNVAAGSIVVSKMRWPREVFQRGSGAELSWLFDHIGVLSRQTR